VECSKPWHRREVRPVAGVFVAIGGETGLLTQTSRLGGWAEEGPKQTEFGERWVRSGVAVWSEWDAVFGIGTDDGGLCAITLALSV
jgi:hypothetical protein